MSARNKILKKTGEKPQDLELQIAQAMYDLESNDAELKPELRPLQFVGAKELDAGNGRKAIVIFVPVPLLKQFHKVQNR